MNTQAQLPGSGWNNAVPTPYPTAETKQPKGWGKFFGALGLSVLVFMLQGLFLTPALAARTDDGIMTVLEIAGGLAALLFIVMLGGKGATVPSLKGMRESWRIIRWIFLADLVIAIVDAASYFLDDPGSLAPLWPLRIIMLLLLCAGVGLFEETLFRGLCLNGLLARMGANKKGIVAAAVISSLIFGAAHIDPAATDFGDPLQLLQALLKILQAGAFGFAAAVAMIKTRNIWPLVLLHGLNDFMLMFVSNGLFENPVTTEYVSSGEDAPAIVAVYLVLILAYLPSLIAAWRALRQHPAPDRGIFYRARSASPYAGYQAYPQMGSAGYAPAGYAPAGYAPTGYAPASYAQAVPSPAVPSTASNMTAEPAHLAYDNTPVPAEESKPPHLDENRRG